MDPPVLAQRESQRGISFVAVTGRVARASEKGVTLVQYCERHDLSEAAMALRDVRISVDGERQDRRIVNSRIGRT